MTTLRHQVLNGSGQPIAGLKATVGLYAPADAPRPGTFERTHVVSAVSDNQGWLSWQLPTPTDDRFVGTPTYIVTGIENHQVLVSVPRTVSTTTVAATRIGTVPTTTPPATVDLVTEEELAARLAGLPASQAFGRRPAALLGQLSPALSRPIPAVSATQPTLTFTLDHQTVTDRNVPPVAPNAALLGHTAVFNPVFGHWVADRAGAGIGLEFVHTGSTVEWGYQLNTDALDARVWIWVDGEPLTPTYIDPGMGDHPGYHVFCRMDFGSVATRRITVWGGNVRGWTPICTGTTDVVSAPPPRARIAVVGDSFLGGSNGTSHPLDLPSVIAGFHLGVEAVNCGVGGSGYISFGQDGTTFGSPARVAYAGAAGPLDALVFVGSVNDDGNDPDLTQAATDCFAAYAAAFPGVPMIVLGPQSSNANDTVSPQRSSAIRKVKAACDASPGVIAFYDMIGTVDGVPPAWSPGLAVATGDRVTALGAVWQWIGASGDTWGVPGVHAHYVPLTWDYWGEGSVGAPAGTGSRDVLLYSDWVHPTTEASRILGIRIANCVRDALRRHV